MIVAYPSALLEGLADSVVIYYSEDAVNLKSGLRRPEDEGKLHKDMVTSRLLCLCSTSTYHSCYTCDLEALYNHFTDQVNLCSLAHGCVDSRAAVVHLGRNALENPLEVLPAGTAICHMY